MYNKKAAPHVKIEMDVKSKTRSNHLNFDHDAPSLFSTICLHFVTRPQCKTKSITSQLHYFGFCGDCCQTIIISVLLFHSFRSDQNRSSTGMRGDSQTFVDLVLYYLSVIMYIVYWLESIEGLREGAKPK